MIAASIRRRARTPISAASLVFAMTVSAIERSRFHTLPVGVCRRRTKLMTAAASPSPALCPSSSRQIHGADAGPIEAHADDDEINEQDQGPAEVVADDLSLLAHETARRDADAGGLRRDRLADFGADRIEARQQQGRHAELHADERLELAEHRINRCVAPDSATPMKPRIGATTMKPAPSPEKPLA